MLFVFALSAIFVRSQEIPGEKPVQTIDEEITAFAFAPDGRIVYSVRHLFKTKQYDLQRDDIWLAGNDGKRRRLLLGEKFIRGSAPFSYAVDSFRWSPNGRLILAQLFTTSVVDDSGKTEDLPMTLLLDDSGKEIRLGGRDSTIADSSNAWWLADNATIVSFKEVLKPRALFSLRYFTLASGPAGPAFEGRTFLDADEIPHTNAAIAVERDPELKGPPRLQRLDLLAQEDKELATLGAYAGGMQVSPGGAMAAYYLDREVLEVRDIKSPDHAVRLRVGFGAFQWTPDEKRIVLKRTPEKKSGDLVWIEVPPLASFAKTTGSEPIPVQEPALRSLLFGLTFRDFAISPDGRLLAVIQPGKRSLLVFPMPR